MEVNNINSKINPNINYEKKKKSDNSPLYKLLTYKPEIKSRKKQRLIDAGMSLSFGLLTTSTSLSIKKLHFKDIFNYKNLNSVQRENLKVSYLFGLFSALLFAFHASPIFKTKNKSNNGENNIESQSKDNNCQLRLES